MTRHIFLLSSVLIVMTSCAYSSEQDLNAEVAAESIEVSPESFVHKAKKNLNIACHYGVKALALGGVALAFTTYVNKLYDHRFNRQIMVYKILLKHTLTVNAILLLGWKLADGLFPLENKS